MLIAMHDSWRAIIAETRHVMRFLKMLLLSFVALPLLFAQVHQHRSDGGITRTNPDSGKEPLQIQDSSSSANRVH
jgi:hypothetical protein